MSRSNKSRGARRKEPSIWRAHKRVRVGVHQALDREVKCASEAWLEVLADLHEEQGRTSLAERLRRGAEVQLPRAPAGFNTRLRW